MKKFFVALLVLAIAAGNLFAEVSWGGYALSAVTIVGGSTEEDSDIVTGDGPSGSGAWGLYGLGRIQASAANDEGTFGAFVRPAINTASKGNWDNAIRAFVWWQPISQVKLQIGFFGDMALQQTVGWGFHASGADDTVAFDGYGRRGRSLWSFGGEPTGLLLALAPIEGLSIKIGVPYAGKGPEAAETYNHIIGQVTYDIASVGQIAVTYQSGHGYRYTVTPGTAAVPGYWKYNGDKTKNPTTNASEWEWVPEVAGTDDKAVDDSDPGAVYAQFFLSGVDKLQLNVGLKYTLPGEYGPDGFKVTVAKPITAGFGVAYAVSDTIAVKARLGASFAGSTTTKTIAGTTTETDIKDPTLIGFDVMPSFDVGVCKVLLNMGIAVDLPDEGDSVFNWYFNPYITKSAGGGTFYAGLQVFSAQDAIGEDIIKWGIPIGIDVGF